MKHRPQGRGPLGQSSRSRSRSRRGLALLALLISIPLIVACGDDSSNDGSGGSETTAAADWRSPVEISSDELIVADYGGDLREAREDAFYAPFAEATDVRPVSADADPAKIELFAERGRAEWDMIDLDHFDVLRFGRDGKLQRLPPEVTRADLIEGESADFAVGGYFTSAGIGYRTDEGPAPRSWADFFDTRRFPGKRGLPSFGLWVVEAALLADGVRCDELFPLDFDRAFAKLDTIRDDTIFWDSLAQGLQLLAQGSVSQVLSTNGRVTVLKQDGAPVDYVWNQALLTWSASGVLKGAPNADAAFAMADLMAQPERQAELARAMFYGPSSAAALELLDDEVLELLPNSAEHAAVACETPPEALAEQIDEYYERYAEWLAQD